MGTAPRNSGDRLRTIWTPDMDRYFIELMLEQVGKGNRFDDHLFSKRAWKHMSSLFNAKFKFPFEKDVLKNRHKTLRNLYKAVKNLLDEKGFSWDDKRQMVTADNNVWDEYIKVHPDARSYRIKTIPYYNELCLIYGDRTTEQKGDSVPESPSDMGGDVAVSPTQPKNASEAAADTLNGITKDEDYEISMLKRVVDDTMQAMPNGKRNTQGTRTRTSWHPPMDRYFIDLMLDQVQKGNQIEGVFRKQAWMEMIAAFNAKFGFNYDVDVLKNRYKTLRRQYNVIKNLLELNGFVWDDARQMVTADDSVWQDYIKAHTDARQFMTRPVPYFKDLCLICNDLSFDESDCFSIQCLELENEDQEIKLHRTSKNSQSPVAMVSSDGEILTTNSKKKHQLENQSDLVHPKKPRGNDESMACALREMATAVSSLTDKNKDDEASNSIAIENVIAAVQALPEMDEELILDACDLLEDEVKAKTFLALDVKLRKKWLLRKLRPQV